MVQLAALDQVEERFRAFQGVQVEPDVQQPGYTIDVEFLGGLTEGQKTLFKSAARRWSRVISGDVPDVNVGGRIIDDILIQASGIDIDGEGRVLGRAGPTRIRQGSKLPAAGIMEFDVADLAAMEADGRLEDVIVHEMGHCLGIGTLWQEMGLITGAGGPDPVFTGTRAIAEYSALTGETEQSIPVENTGGAGTRDGHWRDSVFGNEMMTGFISSRGNPISRMTVAALGDMGYGVHLGGAEPYSLPGPSLLASWSFSLDGLEVERPDYETVGD
ncbi:MAG: leishmanolysin [Pseudomonadota bacterium]|nr:leishmanolysin [Pseudomonadota bacterium]